MFFRGSYCLFVSAPRLRSVHSGQLSGVWANRNLGDFVVPFFVSPVDPLSQLFHGVLNSYWFFSKEGAAGRHPAAHASPSGANVREVGLFFGRFVDRPDLRDLRLGLSLGVLVGLYLHPATLAFDRLRPPASLRVDRSAVKYLGPLVRASFGAWRHRGPSTDLDTELQEPEHPAKPHSEGRVHILDLSALRLMPPRWSGLILSDLHLPRH